MQQLAQMIGCTWPSPLVPSQLPLATRAYYVELAYLMTKFNQLPVTDANMLEFFELLCRAHSNLSAVCNEEYEYFATALYYPSVLLHVSVRTILIIPASPMLCPSILIRHRR